MDICVPGNRLEMNGARALTLVLARTQLTQLDLSCTCLLITHLAEYSGWLLKAYLSKSHNGLIRNPCGCILDPVRQSPRPRGRSLTRDRAGPDSAQAFGHQLYVQAVLA